MYKLSRLILFVLIFSGCSNTSGTKSNGVSAADSPVYIPLLDSSTTGHIDSTFGDTGKIDSAMDFHHYLVPALPDKDCQVIKEDVVIFVSPDSDQIEAMKREMGDTAFYIVADDVMWYQSEANEFLKTKSAKVIVPDERYLRFETTGAPLFFDTRAKASAGWLIILFKKGSVPRLVHSVGIKDEYEKYFGK